MTGQWRCVMCQSVFPTAGEGRRHVYSHLNQELWPYKCPVKACEYFCKYLHEYDRHRRSRSHDRHILRNPVQDREPLPNPKKINLMEGHWLEECKERMERKEGKTGKRKASKERVEKEVKEKRRKKEGKENVGGEAQEQQKQERKERKPLAALIKPVNLSDSEDSLDSVDIQRAEAILDKELGKRPITGGNYPMLDEILPDEELDLTLDEEKKEKEQKEVKNERKIKIKAEVHQRPKDQNPEPYTPTKPSISDTNGKSSLKLKSPTYIPTPIGNIERPVTIEEIVPARDLEEATAPCDPTLFGPMRKMVSPLPEECPPARNLKEDEDVKEDKDLKEDENVKEYKDEDKEDERPIEVGQGQSQEKKWELIRIEPEKSREEWLSGSIRFRMGAWLDEFFYLTATLHGHPRDVRCRRCNEAEKTILAGVRIQDKRLLNMLIRDFEFQDPRF